MEIKDNIWEIQVPTNLIASHNDEMVPFEHFEKIYEHFGQTTVRMLVSDKTHSETREMAIIAECFRDCFNSF